MTGPGPHPPLPHPAKRPPPAGGMPDASSPSGRSNQQHARPWRRRRHFVQTSTSSHPALPEQLGARTAAYRGDTLRHTVALVVVRLACLKRVHLCVHTVPPITDCWRISETRSKGILDVCRSTPQQNPPSSHMAAPHRTGGPVDGQRRKLAPACDRLTRQFAECAVTDRTIRSPKTPSPATHCVIRFGLSRTCGNKVRGLTSAGWWVDLSRTFRDLLWWWSRQFGPSLGLSSTLIEVTQPWLLLLQRRQAYADRDDARCAHRGNDVASFCRRGRNGRAQQTVRGLTVHPRPGRQDRRLGCGVAKLPEVTWLTLLESQGRQQAERAALAEVWEDHDLVFPLGTGTPMEPSNLSRSFARLRETAGLPGVRLHDLRHTVVSLLLELGVPPHVVQAIAQHADVKITLKVYAHANLDAMRQALGKRSSRECRCCQRCCQPVDPRRSPSGKPDGIGAPAGIEPATSRLQGECSGQLSYRGACVEVSIATDVRLSRSRGLPSTGIVNNPTQPAPVASIDV